MRPRTLDEFVGQDHIVGPGRLLRRVIQADRLASIIFYGPPGTGKTTLARVIANSTKSHFITMNAVLSGVKELRHAIEEAQEHRSLHGRRTLLFVDEVHRWNKAQQDALLPWVENGTVILIGATTQNPFFEVNSALVSRSRVFQLRPLQDDDLRRIARAALTDKTRGYGSFNVVVEEEALEHVISVANGDARSLLNALELAVETTPATFPPPEETEIRITLDVAEESIQRKVVLYDKEGDYHFDTISAFIKSIRGSDPDAALYWMARMIYAGEEPRFIFRRMLISAAEDIGLADPQALAVVEAAAAAFDRVGMPEGQFFLSEAALYLATAAKSNSTLAFFDAIETVEREKTEDVPTHLKDANRDGKGFGHGEGYLYPHAYRDHWVPQHYLPDSLRGAMFYEPGTLGYEGARRTEILRRREAQLAAIDGEHHRGEILTFTPPQRSRDRWFARLVEQRGKTLEGVRRRVFELSSPARHYNILDLHAGAGLLLWEALRQSPEGLVVGMVKSGRERFDALLQGLDETERPVLYPVEGLLVESLNRIGEVKFERIIGFNLFATAGLEPTLFETVGGLLSSDGKIVLAELVPAEGQTLAEILRSSSSRRDEKARGSNALEMKPGELADLLAGVEHEIRSEVSIKAYRWTGSSIRNRLEAAGFSIVSLERRFFFEERLITPRDIDAWLDPTRSPYGEALARRVDENARKELNRALAQIAERGPVAWRRAVVFVVALTVASR